MDILQIVKALLQITDSEKDMLLNVHIDIVTQKVLDYCNLWELPDGLKYVVAELAAEAYRLSEVRGDILSGEKVSSISEDGRSVGFIDPGKALDISGEADKMLPKLRILDKYKKLYKVGHPPIKGEDGDSDAGL